MLLILNEKEFIEDILSCKDRDVIEKKIKNIGIMRLASLIGKLYNNDKNKTELIDIVKNKIKELNVYNYYEFQYDKKINSLCKKIVDNNLQLREVDFVPVYKEELDFIFNNCSNNREKKLMFSFFVFGRFNNNSGWTNVSLTDLFKISNICATRVNQDKLLYELIEVKHILNKSNNNQKLNYKVELIEGKNPLIKVTKFENLGNLYIAYEKSKTHKQCTICGKLIKITSKTCPPKYCDDCAKEIFNEQCRVNMAKLREKDKNVIKVKPLNNPI